MQKIGKSHPIIQLFKEIIKTNKYPDYIVTDDLEVLKLALRYHLTIPHLIYSDEEDYQPETKIILEELIATATNSYEISLATYQSLKLKENHVGIMAMIQVPTYTKEQLGDFVIVLDHLELPGNIGTIYRTLDACGATGVILVDPICKPYSTKCVAAARGTNLIKPTLTMTYEEAQEFLLKDNYTIYLGEPELGKNYQAYDYQGKIAIVVGNERFGIHSKWYEHPHQKVYIPMQGNNHSINVSVAASILAYEAAMKRKDLNS